MNRKLEYLEKIYERDQTSNAYIIPVALDRYSDMFSEWDPAPFKKRDLDYDLRQYLVNCSSDIPFECDTVLCFNVLESARNGENEERAIIGLKTYYSFYLRSLEYELRVTRKRSLLFGFISALLLFTAVSLSVFAAENNFYLVIIEGIYIGGWVFLWEAISTSFFRSRKAKSEYLHYKRFSNSPIRFKYVTAHS